MPRAGTPRKPGIQPRYASRETVETLLAASQPQRITPKAQRFAELLASGVPYGEASSQAGFKSKSSAFYALKNPVVQQYLKSIQAESRAIAAYDLATAMQEALDVLHFAKEKGNAMAYCKAVELRAKLSGLLVDRVEVVSVDLTGALARAESRVLSLPSVCTQTPQAQPQAVPDKIV